MFEEQLYPTSIAMLPSVVLERHKNIIEKYGLENVLSKREFKKAREMYETTIYTLGLTAKTGTQYWVCPASEKNETPDTFIISVPTENKKMDIECIEMAIWNEHVDEMFKIIEGKLKKAYPSNFCIVIHVAQKEGSVISSQYYADIHSQLKNMNVPAGAVRLWHSFTRSERLGSIQGHMIGELYPLDWYEEFSNQTFDGVVSKYNLNTQKTIRIDVDSMLYPTPKRFIFKNEDLNVPLPNLPEL